MITLRIFEAKK